MLSLFTFRYENAFRLYALLFVLIFSVERYWWHEVIHNCNGTYYPYFFAHNYLRILLFLTPFIYFKFFRANTNLPFVFFGLSVLALPHAQLFYIALFFINCALIRHLRSIFAMGLLGALLLLITLPNFIGKACMNNFRVKDNMYSFQTMLQYYADDSYGHYPADVNQLKKIAVSKNYWKNSKNPSGYAPSFRDISKFELSLLKTKRNNRWFTNGFQLDLLGIRFHEVIPHPNYKGAVLYHRTSPTTYVIYGVNSESNTLILYREKPFTLTNS